MTKIIDIKSLLIGFLLATSVMLFMGARNSNENGRYQGFASMAEIYAIDTQNGDFYFLTADNEKVIWNKDFPPIPSK